jgi:hypothetical protein
VKGFKAIPSFFAFMTRNIMRQFLHPHWAVIKKNKVMHCTLELRFDRIMKNKIQKVFQIITSL